MTSYGIDFGTTNSVVARFDNDLVEVLDIDQPPLHWQNVGFERVMPSVVAIGAGREPLFGWEARRTRDHLAAVKRLLRDTEQTAVGGESFEVEEVATMLFRQLSQAAAGMGSPPIDQAVVTVPANSRGVARHRTKVCAGMAGIRVPALINEPTAAAMAASFRAPYDDVLMVVDWGGGTLDVTVLRSVEGVFLEEASSGVGRLGGIDFDSSLATLLEPDASARRAWDPAALPEYQLAVERAKIRLSSEYATEVRLPTGEARRVSRTEFEEATRRLVEGVRGPIGRCLEDVKGSPISRVVLVGGTCNIPSVRSMVTDLVGLEPAEGVDPMTAIAEGAAIASAILAGELEDNDFFVSTEHALGVIVLDHDMKREEFSVIIPRNHKLPAKRTESYVPVNDYQEAVDLRIIEGDPDQALDHEDNVVYAEFETKLPSRRVEEGAFELTLEYDVDGCLDVIVSDPASGGIFGQETISFGAAADPRRRVEIAKRVEQTFESGTVAHRDASASGPLSPEAEAAVLSARTKVLPYVDEDEQRELEQAIAEVLSTGKHAELERMLQRRWPYLLS